MSSAECKRCRAEIFYDQEEKVWRSFTPKARVTCPTGGPHDAEIPKVSWAAFENALTSWEDGAL